MVRWNYLLLSVIIGIPFASFSSTNATHLHINVITAISGSSTLQCWSVEPPFTVSQQPGTVGARIQALGDTTAGDIVFFNETHNVDSGLHRAPSPQWGIVLKGSALVTFPNTSFSLHIVEGDIFMGLDTPDVSELGHESKFVAGTVLMQVPFKDRVVPQHTIINRSGPCPVVGSIPHDHHSHHRTGSRQPVAERMMN